MLSQADVGNHLFQRFEPLGRRAGQQAVATVLDDLARQTNTRAHGRHTHRQVLQQLERELGLLEGRVVERHQAHIKRSQISKGRFCAPRPRVHRQTGQTDPRESAGDNAHDDRVAL